MPAWGPVTRADGQAVHEIVRDAATRGVPAVFGDNQGTRPHAKAEDAGSNAVAGGDGTVDGDELAPYDDAKAWAGRTIDGDWLSEFLTTRADEIHGRGLTIVGARIAGGLDLEGATLPRRFGLVRCQLGTHRIILRDAHTRTVQLDSVACGGIAAERVHVGGSLLLDESGIDGTVRLVDARIEASFVANGARIDPPETPATSVVTRIDAPRTPASTVATTSARVAIDADRARVDGSIILGSGFSATGSVRLFGADIGGDVFLVGADVRNPTGGTVRASGAEVGGSVVLDKTTLHGEAQMFGVKVGRDISCKRARLNNPDGDSLSIDGADVGGGVMLQRSVVHGRIRLVNSAINGDLRCGGARIEGSVEGAMSASRASIGGNVFLDLGFTATGKVRFPGASIGRALRCTSATLSTPDGVALEADGARVGAGVQLNHDFRSHGEVRLVGITIGAGLDCTAGTFDCGELGHTAMEARNSRIDGNVFCDKGFSARGTVRFVGATIRGELNLRGASLIHPEGGPAFHATGAEVGGALFLTDGFTAQGEVRMLGISVGGDLFAAGATITGVRGPRYEGVRAMTLTRARVRGDLSLTQNMHVDGMIRLARATIAGNLQYGTGTFRHAGAQVLDVSHAQITGGMVVANTATLEGQLNLTGITVGGSVEIGTVRLTEPAGGRAIVASNARVAGAFGMHGDIVGAIEMRGISVGADLSFGGAHVRSANGDDPVIQGDRAQITGSLLLNNGFETEGEVRFRSATVNGHTSCMRARLSNHRGRALNLTASTITAGLVLGEMEVRGETRLMATTVRGNVGFEGTRLINPHGEAALMAAGLQVEGNMFLGDRFHAEGPVVLRGATVDTLQDDSLSWPESLDLDGFRYDRLVCPPRDRGWQARREWLRRQMSPSAQGYVHLAHVYRSAGDETDARRILIERHNTLLRPPDHWHDQLPHGPWEVLRKAWRWLLRITIGHGYAPGRALLIAVPLVLLMAVWVNYAQSHDMMVPTAETAGTSVTDELPRSSDCTSDYPCVYSFVYAVDDLIPFLDFGQRTHWAPDQSHRGDTWLDDGSIFADATWGLRALGSVLAALVTASFTRVVRRE